MYNPSNHMNLPVNQQYYSNQRHPDKQMALPGHHYPSSPRGTPRGSPRGSPRQDRRGRPPNQTRQGERYPDGVYNGNNSSSSGGSDQPFRKGNLSPIHEHGRGIHSSREHLLDVHRGRDGRPSRDKRDNDKRRGRTPSPSPRGRHKPGPADGGPGRDQRRDGERTKTNDKPAHDKDSLQTSSVDRDKPDSEKFQIKEALQKTRTTARRKAMCCTLCGVILLLGVLSIVPYAIIKALQDNKTQTPTKVIASTTGIPTTAAAVSSSITVGHSASTGGTISSKILSTLMTSTSQTTT